jgi:hypothetical protein
MRADAQHTGGSAKERLWCGSHGFDDQGCTAFEKARRCALARLRNGHGLRWTPQPPDTICIDVNVLKRLDRITGMQPTARRSTAPPLYEPGTDRYEEYMCNAPYGAPSVRQAAQVMDVLQKAATAARRQ